MRETVSVTYAIVEQFFADNRLESKTVMDIAMKRSSRELLAA
jgi:hypothetical protein